MVVMGVLAFILCNRHRWRKKKRPTALKQYHPEFPENKEVFCFTSSLSMASTRSFEWNLESINICTNCHFIWSGKVYIWLSDWEYQKLFLWQPCLNKLVHVERLRNWSTSTWLLCGHFIQIHSCMGICSSCMYTNKSEHFYKWFGTLCRDNSVLMRVPRIR